MTRPVQFRLGEPGSVFDDDRGLSSRGGRGAEARWIAALSLASVIPGEPADLGRSHFLLADDFALGDPPGDPTGSIVLGIDALELRAFPGHRFQARLVVEARS